MLDRFFVVVVFHILPWDSTENPIGQIPHQGFSEMSLKKKKGHQSNSHSKRVKSSLVCLSLTFIYYLQGNVRKLKLQRDDIIYFLINLVNELVMSKILKENETPGKS